MQTNNAFMAQPLPSYIFAIWIGLYLPDIDLLALSILHHRSIITHSVLLPFLLSAFFYNRFSVYELAGLYGGVAIHLATDGFSPPVGFGMVWTPEPFKYSLGAASPFWLFANAGLGLWLSLKLIPENKLLFIATLTIIAITYAILNEGYSL